MTDTKAKSCTAFAAAVMLLSAISFALPVIASESIGLANRVSSTYAQGTWSFPDDMTASDPVELGGMIIGTNAVSQSLGSSTASTVSASVLAAIPETSSGTLISFGVQGGHSVHARYNGSGTFLLSYDNAAAGANNTVTTRTVDVTGVHIWTLSFDAENGASFYRDDVKVADAPGIKWTYGGAKKISGSIEFGSRHDQADPLTGAALYALRTDFLKGTIEEIAAIFFDTFDFLDELPDGATLDEKLEAFTRYSETGVAYEPSPEFDPEKDEVAETCVLRISEIMPKPTDAQNHGKLAGLDVNGLESGWVEVENTSSDKWADLGDYRFIRVNRGKKTNIDEPGNLPSRMIPPGGRAVFYTSERYPNSDTPEESAFQHVVDKADRVKPVVYEDYGNIIVYGKKVNPKKSPFVRLYYMPDSATPNIVDTVVVPSDLPEGWSIIVGDAAEGKGTRRWMCPTPTCGKANSPTDGLRRIGPNVGPLYENKEVKKGVETIGTKHEDSPNEFVVPVPPAVPGEDYTVKFSLNPVMHPTVAGGFRNEDTITNIVLVYRTDLTNAEHRVSVDLSTDAYSSKDWGHTYTVAIPAADLPAPGHVIQWKFKAVDGEGVEWTSPSFNNPDDGYEWYGTIVEASGLESATLPTWHMFAAGDHLKQMDKDKDDQNLSLVPNYARIAIYDSSTSNYYDYVRIDLRGHTSAGFTKKGHGLRFAKAHPLAMTDVVSGDMIEGIRKTSLISEFADPSYMRQMIAFWLWRKMGNLVPFDFPVRCNLNGAFYQLAFNSERFTDELIEDVYGLDKYGYGYKNVGTLKSGSGTTAGGIEKKTPDDEDESNVTVLESELRSKITAAQNVSSSPAGGGAGLDNAALTKFVVEKFDLPAWLNYLASARITQEMDDVWANLCAYYDNPAMKEGERGTGTWMPLGYDFNLSFGQWYFGDLQYYGVSRFGLSATNDWYKSHPLYGGNRVRAYRNESMAQEMNGNDGYEAVLQSAKFRRLFLRRLRTLMDQELKEPGTATNETPFMVKMYEMANLMRADAALDTKKWPNNSSDNAIDVWTTRPANMDAGIQDIWENYVVPRREHLYVTHSATNTARTIGYGSNLNAGIPEAQSPIEMLKPGFSVVNTTDLRATAIDDTEKVVIRNANAEAVDMSGWRLAGRFAMTLPAGAVVDADDTITVVVDRKAYIAAHDSELTDQVVIGNAKLDAGSTTLLLTDADGVAIVHVAPVAVIPGEDVGLEAATREEAEAALAGCEIALSAEDKAAGLAASVLKLVAVPLVSVDASTGLETTAYVARVAVDETKVPTPALGLIEDGGTAVDPLAVAADGDGQKVTVGVRNATVGLWYGFEWTDSLKTVPFGIDVESFKRAESSSVKIESKSEEARQAQNAFFRVKVEPARPLRP